MAPVKQPPVLGISTCGDAVVENDGDGQHNKGGDEAREDNEEIAQPVKRRRIMAKASDEHR